MTIHEYTETDAERIARVRAALDKMEHAHRRVIDQCAIDIVGKVPGMTIDDAYILLAEIGKVYYFPKEVKE